MNVFSMFGATTKKPYSTTKNAAFNGVGYTVVPTAPVEGGATGFTASGITIGSLTAKLMVALVQSIGTCGEFVSDITPVWWIQLQKYENLPPQGPVKIDSVLQTVVFTKPARPMNFAMYCFIQWISKLPRSFEIHWVKQYYVNVVLFGMKDF